ncbi:hypothetical protein BKP42_49870 [Rhodococcus erythropolis]|uniref:hypothetical protein n=1 Tax=Rhodococcus erythropolis TaxID=1833 RepID=UPI001179999E|nr:hypothetical protein [Rhodococcus erythropolis]PBI93205.1 hypothetical protein BKP42_49870 [Rhodococcus erythropolis]
MQQARTRVSIAGLGAGMIILAAAACGSGGSPGGGGGSGSGLQYGSEEYFDARIALYEEGGWVDPGVLTKEHLPWDPNGPTIKVRDVREQMIEATNAKGEYAGEADDFENLVLNVEGICTGAEFHTGTLDEGEVAYDKAEYVDEVIGTLWFGSYVGDGGIDARGGIDCENGQVAGGTGYPVFSDYGPHDENDEIHDFGFYPQPPSSRTVVEPLTP